MSEMKASVALNLTGNFEQRAERYGRAVGQFSRNSERQLGRVRRSAQRLGRGLDAMGNRYTALITGAGSGIGKVASIYFIVGFGRTFLIFGFVFGVD